MVADPYRLFLDTTSLAVSLKEQLHPLHRWLARSFCQKTKVPKKHSGSLLGAFRSDCHVAVNIVVAALSLL